MKVANNVMELIGNTPLVKINSLSEKSGANIYGKCEFMNPGGSVKDRIGMNMIKVAMEEGKIKENTVVIEPTSGNTGIALASICASLGIRLILVMPESMSLERRYLLKALGAELKLTPADKGMKGALDKVMQLGQEMDNTFIPQQFENAANPEIHRKTTALEIWDDMEGQIDMIVAGIGTGGSITGIGETLKEKKPDIKVVAVEPKDSPVLSGGKPGPHKIQGIGAGFVPGVLNTDVYDEVIQIGNEEAMETSRRFGKEEGILVGISAGANLQAAFQLASRTENKGKNIVTILCDTGERYLSTSLFETDEA